MARTCSCLDFERGMKWVNGCEDMAKLHHGATCPPDLEYMKYCAWCGRKLVDEEETKVMPFIKPLEE